MRCVAMMVVAVAVLVLAPTARADWPGVTAKWDQGSGGHDPWGFASWIDDVNGTAMTADDFLCTAPGPIKEIEFAGYSAFGNAYLNGFRVTFWTDVPATAADASHPGSLIYDRTIGPANPGDPLKIGWQDLGNEWFLINLSTSDWFWQEGGGTSPMVYWIGIQGVMAADGYGDAFYWYAVPRTIPSWGDDAAFESEYFGYPPWANWGWPTNDAGASPDLYDGPFPAGWANSADAAFTLRVPEPATLCLMGAGAIGMLLRRRRK